MNLLATEVLYGNFDSISKKMSWSKVFENVSSLSKANVRGLQSYRFQKINDITGRHLVY